VSEYIEIESELSEDGQRLTCCTNLTLTDQAQEVYRSPQEMEEGSPLAHALAIIPGITHLTIAPHDLTLRKDPGADWHAIVADVSAAIKDFFL
jgi:hypothetical protein